jgi:hypothetical protein
MRCMIAGYPFNLETSEVEAAMRGVEPEPIRSGACAQIGGRWYPVMQIGAKVTGQDRRDFTGAEVYRALSSLGLTCRPTPPVAS